MHSNHKRWTLTVAAAAASALALTACTGGTSSDPTGDSGDELKVLRLATTSAPVSMDPGKASNGSDQAWFQSLVYESLTNVDENGQLVPGLAVDWGYVDGSGGTEFEVTLREGALFADGTPVTAEAVADSVTWFAETATNGVSGSFKGWVAEATGDSTVLITLPEPNPIVPDLLSPWNLGGNIVSAAGLADPAALSNETFGAGPYVYDVKQSIVGNRYVYVPNENFYDPDRIHFDRVEILVTSNATSALSALQTGQVDVLYGDTSTAEVAEASGFNVIDDNPRTYFGMFILDWDGKIQPALGKTAVRQAMNYAIDREAIAEAILGKYGEPTMQPNTPGWDAFDESLEDTYPYDPAKAKELLAEAGYPDGFSFELIYAAYETATTQIVQAIAEQLSEVGIAVNLTAAATVADLGTGYSSGEYSAASLRFAGQTQLANTRQLWLETSPINPLGNAPVEGLEEAFAAYLASTDEESRSTSAQAVERIVVDEALTVTAVTSKSLWVANPDLKGIATDPRGLLTNVADWSK